MGFPERERDKKLDYHDAENLIVQNEGIPISTDKIGIQLR